MLLLTAVPDGSFAFRAPDEPQSVIGKKMEEGATLQLQTINQRNLKSPISGDPVKAALQLAEELMNHPTGQQLSASGPSLSSAPTTIPSADRVSRASLSNEQTDKIGFQHIRIAQQYKGLPVVGAQLIVHINDKGLVYMINGRYQADTNISITPTVVADDALQIGLNEQQGKKNMQVTLKPTLVIYGPWLAWSYVIEYKDKEPGRWRYYVDAQNGNLINSYNDIQYAAPNQGSGIPATVSGNLLAGENGSHVNISGFYESTGSHNYFLYNFNNLWGIYDVDAADWEQQTTSDWVTNDQAAASCAKNFSDTQNYVSTVLSRASFDNASAFAQANVHEGDNYANAYWNGSQFYFGDGDGIDAHALTVLDVAAHEYGHAITQYTSNLAYQYESGALNEAYSDILGCTVEFAKQPDGTSAYPNRTAGSSDWLMGEDAWLSDVALRDMRNPQRYGQPSYYHGTNWYSGSGDNGGVHTNSGVANFAYYLLAMGGSGSNDGHAYNITGIGETAAAAVALRANYYYHTSSSQYADARTAWIQAASDLGYNTQTVADVWTACGVKGATSTSLTCNLWNQPVSSINTNAYANQDFETTYDSYDIFIADDFTTKVPWVIDTLFVPGGLWNGAGTLANANTLHFEIYRDNGGKPDGDPKGGGNSPVWSLSVPPSDSQITIGLDSSGTMGNVTLTLQSPVRLQTGTYWLVFYPQMDLAVGGQYGRSVADTNNLSPAQVINPGGGFGFPTTWGNASSPYGTSQTDFAFCLQGKEGFPWPMFLPTITKKK